MRNLSKAIENLVSATIDSVCNHLILPGTGVHGNGILQEATYSIDTVSQLTIEGPWDGVMQCDAAENSMKITADANLMEFIVVENIGGHLHVGFRKSVFASEPLRLELQLQKMPEKISESGSCCLLAKGMSGDSLNCKISGESKFKSPDVKLGDMKIKISGSSKVKCNIDCDMCDLTVAGTSKVKLEGTICTLDADISGASKAEIRTADIVDISVSGASKLTIAANKSITGSISGASQVKYSGVSKPAIRTSGESQLKKE